MKKLLILIVLCTACLKSVYVNASVVYAAPDGKSDGSSYVSPTSFTNGLNLISQPGDTLYLKEGTYLFSALVKVVKNGSAETDIVIAGYPGEKAVMDFRKVPYGTRGLFIHENSTYVHVSNLAICYSGKNNLYCEGSHCTFSNLDIYGSADTGCQMKKGGNNTIINVDSHDNFDYKLGDVTAADFGGNADGFADKQFTGAPNRYIGCRAWNNSDDGWDFYERVSADGAQTVIENCICFANGPREYDMRQCARYETDKEWFDRFKDGLSVTDDDGNVKTVSLEHYTNWGNGNGFKLGGKNTVHNVLMHHCLAVANTVKGFDQNNNAGVMYVYNCTGMGNGSDFGFGNKTVGTLSVRNCISYFEKVSISCKTLANDFNTWTLGITPAESDFVSLDTSLATAPRRTDGTLPNNGFMHLTASSTMINRGTEVGYEFYGTAPDLGCYEFGMDEPALVTDPVVTHKPIKRIVNGQICIFLNGQIYNTLGQIL